MVRITQLPKIRAFDYRYGFEFDTDLALDPIWINMKKHFFTRKVPRIPLQPLVPPNVQILISKSGSFFPDELLVRDNIIELRGFLPVATIGIDIEEKLHIFGVVKLYIEKFADENFISQADLQAILGFFAPPPLNVLKIQVKDFIYWIESNWNYKLNFDFPEDWGKGYITDDWSYGTKYRNMMFVSFFFNQTMNIFKNKWHNYSPSEIAKRKRAGLTSTRVLRYDTNGQVLISATRVFGRRKGISNFSAFSHLLPSIADLNILRQKAELKRYKTTFVSGVGM